MRPKLFDIKRPDFAAHPIPIIRGHAFMDGNEQP